MPRPLDPWTTDGRIGDPESIIRARIPLGPEPMTWFFDILPASIGRDPTEPSTQPPCEPTDQPSAISYGHSPEARLHGTLLDRMASADGSAVG